MAAYRVILYQLYTVNNISGDGFNVWERLNQKLQP